MSELAWSTHARTVARRVDGRLDELVEDLGAAYRREVDEYAALDPERMAAEVLPVSRELVAEFVGAVVAGRLPEVDRVRVLATMGRRRLEMGVPLEPMLHVYRVCGRVVWDALARAATADEYAALGPLGAGWMDFIDRASSVAAASYLDASHDQLRQADARRDALLDALLEADGDVDVLALATEFQTRLADSYLPLIGQGDDAVVAVDAAVAAAPRGTVGGIRGPALVLLVPGPATDAELAPVVEATGWPVLVAGEPAAPGAALSAAVKRGLGALQVARAVGATGVVGPDDLLVERLMAADPDLAARLRNRVWDRLVAADRSEVLAETLTTYLRTGSVPATAEAEFVHANTVAYRLRRVAEITGCDPRVPADAVTLHLAHLASRTAP